MTAGTLLRRAREAAGLHVAALAVSLKVPVRKLEALESDRYDELSDAVFVRALASSVCRTLKIDAQPVLERLPQSAAPRLVQDSDGLNAPFRGPQDGNGPTWPQQLSKPVILAVFGLLLGALILILLPRMQTSEEGAASEARVAEPPLPEPPTTVAAQPEVARQPAAAATSTAAPANAATSTVRATADPVQPTLPAGAGARPEAAPMAQAPTRAVPASGIVIFQTKGPSWVKVTDANGVVAFRKLMAAGETGSASGAVPLQVTVGRVDVTEVRVRGKPFDMRRVATGNVARFEVK